MERPWWLHGPPISPMLKRRLLTAIPTLIVIVTITFAIVRMAPGGPFRGERAIPEAVRQNVEARYGLDRSLFVQYGLFWSNLVTGSLGPSFQQPERSAVSVLFSGAVPSLIVGLAALFVALLFGLGGGTVAAISPQTGPGWSLASLIALALPVFVLGPLLVQVFAIWLGLLPAATWGSATHVVLPALTLGIPVGGALARFWRVVISEALEEPECMAARTRGLSELAVVRHHAGPRSLPLVINYVGPLAAGLVTGSVVVEKVFSIPGMGRFFVDSALARDYPVVIGATLIYAVVLLSIHTFVDILHIRLDPRLHKDHADWVRAERQRRAELKEEQRKEAAEKKAVGQAQKQQAKQAEQKAKARGKRTTQEAGKGGKR